MEYSYSGKNIEFCELVMQAEENNSYVSIIIPLNRQNNMKKDRDYIFSVVISLNPSDT